MKDILLIILVAMILVSCRTKKIAGGTTVYKFEKNAAGDKQQLSAYTLLDNTDDFTPTADNVIILDPSSVTIDKTSSPTSIHIEALPSLQGVTLNNYFFADVSGIVKAANKFDVNNAVIKFPQPKSLKYSNGYLVLQALSIPYKVRGKLSGPSYTTPISSTVETGFTANLSIGYKFAMNWFRPTKDFLGLNLNSISITPGAFAGLGSTALSATNTLNPPVVPSRTALTNSYGFFALIGISRFGFGYAGGWDHAGGDGGKYWIYKGKYWNGFALSLDLVNF